MRCKYCGKELRYDLDGKKRVLCDNGSGGVDWQMLCTENINKGDVYPFHELDETSEIELLLSEYSEGNSNPDLGSGTDNSI